jgi:hypothetical protein
MMPVYITQTTVLFDDLLPFTFSLHIILGIIDYLSKTFYNCLLISKQVGFRS